MKSSRQLIVAAVALWMVAGQAAGQYQVQVQHGDYGTSLGGEFAVSSVAGQPFVPTIDGDPYSSFCLETTEELWPEYFQDGIFDARISDAARYNNQGPAYANPLNPETAYLYSLWLGYDGGLAHNDYNANLVQRAIWYVEGQPLFGQYNSLVARAQDAVTPGGANDSWYDIYGSTIGNVRVLNLFAPDQAGQYDARRQDLLVRTAEGQPLTPGYWKNHPDAWPVDTMRIGNVVYNFDQLMNLLNTRTPDGRRAANDMSVKLAKFLVATRLSLMTGADPLDMVSIALQADDFLENYGVGFKPKGDLFNQSSFLKGLLDEYLNLENTSGMSTGDPLQLLELQATPIVAEVPEPATLGLLMVGGLLAWRRRSPAGARSARP